MGVGSSPGWGSGSMKLLVCQSVVTSLLATLLHVRPKPASLWLLLYFTSSLCLSPSLASQAPS